MEADEQFGGEFYPQEILRVQVQVECPVDHARANEPWPPVLDLYRVFFKEQREDGERWIMKNVAPVAL